MAGTTDQVNDKMTPIGMMIRTMKAFLSPDMRGQ
jgi:hypothetical protein